MGGVNARKGLNPHFAGQRANSCSTEPPRSEGRFLILANTSFRLTPQKLGTIIPMP